MDKIYDKCCGIDVHKKLIVACFRCGKQQEVREFGATTRELLDLADWLKEGGCEMVAMESTASYWKPLYNILESSDLKAMVVNARHMKAVPGRKTDVKDAEWIADLLQHGLLQPSYIPGKDQRELRELVRYRKSLVGERTRELNRLQKMLEGAILSCQEPYQTSMVKVLAVSWNISLPGSLLMDPNMMKCMSKRLLPIISKLLRNRS